jgi:hypothetical protein
VFCNKQWGDYHDISVEKDVIVTDYGETFVDIPIRNEIFEISNVTIDLKYRSIAVKLITLFAVINYLPLCFIKYIPYIEMFKIKFIMYLTQDRAQ